MNTKMLGHYKVTACATTGEWLDEPEYIDDVPKDLWDRMQDTDYIYHTTYEHRYTDDQGRDIEETRAIEVHHIAS